MESLVNYSSEDEAEMENNIKKRDESSKLQQNIQNTMNRTGDAWSSEDLGGDAKKTRKDDTNYESVQMDMSEESNESSKEDNEQEEAQKEVPASSKHKSRSQAERRRSYSPDNERETSKYKTSKTSKDHRRSSRDYRDKDRNERDRNPDRYRYKDHHHSRKYRDSRRDHDRYRHRRRSSSRERKHRSSSTEGRRNHHRSRSPSRSRDRSHRTPEMRSNPTVASAPSSSVGPSAVMTAGSPPPILQSTTSSPSLAPTVTVPLSTQAKPDRMDWRTQQRVQQLEKMGIDLKKSNESTSIELPSYYNPGVVNPTRYAEQMQKRKLLWSHKKSDNVEQAAAKWETAKFSQDQDGKVASKFMRLMGIKDPPKTASNASSSDGVDLVKKQEELFSTMEQQYEVARQVTHTMRGVGLGFSSQSRPY